MTPPKNTSVWRRLRRYLYGVVLLLGLATVAFYERRRLLTGLAQLWIVNEVPVKADAIMVLGGGIDTRPQAGARMFLQGLAPVILIPQNRLLPEEESGLVSSTHELTAKILVRLGVPTNSIQFIGTNVANTHEEALSLRAWCVENHAKTVLIPTELFHSHRVHWFVNRELKLIGCTAKVQALPQRKYDADNWWLDEAGLIAFETEILKTAYYVLRY